MAAKNKIVAEGANHKVTISLGYAAVSELEPSERNAEGLIRLTDERLYGAKTAGRNRACGE